MASKAKDHLPTIKPPRWLKWEIPYPPRKVNIRPLKIGNPKRKQVFQSSIFRGELFNFRESGRVSSLFFSARLSLVTTVDGSEIPNHHLRCIKPVVNNGINLPYQLEDFHRPTHFHGSIPSSRQLRSFMINASLPSQKL